MPPATVAAYLAALPADRRPAIAKVRDVVRQNLPPGFEEGIQYGMISWFIPPERYGHTYNAQPLAIIALASHKTGMSLYLTGLYADPVVAKWFTAAYAAAGKKLDMGKSCLRFRRLDELPLDVIAKVAAKISVDDYIASYEKEHGGSKQKPIVMPGRSVAAKKATPVAAKAKPKTKPAAAKAKPKTKPAAAKTKSAAAKPKATPVAAKAKPKTKPAAAKAKPTTAKAKSKPSLAAESKHRRA